MAYYTRYQLNVVVPNNFDTSPTAIIWDLLSVEEYDARYALNKDGSCEDETKWYMHEEDMKAFSLKYPSAVFVLRGDGEDHNDIWMKYFQNGKFQLAPSKITFDPFDPAKLK